MQVILQECGRFGLLADISGAILIGKSVFFVKNKELFETSGVTYGYNYHQVVEKVTAKYEALGGSALLILGFMGQYISTTAKGSGIVDLRMDIVFFFLCVLSVVGIIKVSHRMAEWQAKRLVKREQTKTATN